MDAWIYNADIFCDECTSEIRTECGEQGQPDTGDSCDYPQGPFSDGGGDADYPQHCGNCGLFLENPLTSDGYEYIAEAVARGGDVAEQWADFYGTEGREAA